MLAAVGFGVGTRATMGRRRPSYVFDPEKHPHRRVWVSLALVVLGLQAALGIKFVQLSVRQERLADWEDEFSDLGVVCRVAAVADAPRGYAYYFAVPGVTNATAAISNSTTADAFAGLGYKRSKTIASSDDDPAPPRHQVRDLTRCWRPTKNRVHKTFSCGDNRDCYKIFNPKDDLKHGKGRWFLFRCLGIFLCGSAVFFFVFLASFFAFLDCGFRGGDDPFADDAANAGDGDDVELAKTTGNTSV